jgi:hypothetical protein
MTTAGELATDRIDDLVREAEAERLSTSVRAAHARAVGGTTVRRIVRGLTHGVLAPARVSRVTHPEVQHELLGRRVAYFAGSLEDTRKEGETR